MLNFADMIIILIVALVFGLAVRYLYTQKKKGVHCIGCSSAGSCPHNCHCADKTE